MSYMGILVLTGAQVRQLLTPRECAAAMREALTALARGEAYQVLRTVVRPPGTPSMMAVMPSYAAGDDAIYAVKVVCVFHSNPALGLDAHQGAVLLCSGQTGEAVALASGSAITEIRTAAVSAVATDLLARQDATALAVIGTGVQARAHVLAIAEVRPLREVRVAGRTPERARQFAAGMAKQVDVAVTACASAEEAVAGAAIVVTATNSAQPVLRREWLSPGTHINAVGSSIPDAREVDTATMAAAELFVDRRESALNEAGDYLFAAREGAIGPGHIRAELGELLTASAPGRSGPAAITLFKSLGLAVEDLFAARHVYDKARRLGAGTMVDF
jgi:ornithine cyclodeaminase/alanine dehydrogenase-like protein (mu-crystallin family)